MDCNCGLGEHRVSAWQIVMRSNSYSLALLHCFVLLFVMTSPSSAASMCNNDTNYANGSTYSVNLRRVLDHLVHNTSLTGFGTYSYGQSPHKVYGLLQCFQKITQEKCRNCSQEAESRLQADCMNKIDAQDAQVWMTDCFVRYNSLFFSVLDIAPLYLYNDDPTLQNRLPSWNMTFGYLSDLIGIAPGNAGFASNSFSYPLNNTVHGNMYGLVEVQCLRDISDIECRSCLLTGMEGLNSCCSDKVGGQAELGNCTIRFELGTPSPASDSPAPQPSGTNSKKWSQRLAIILGITGSAILGIVSVCIFATRKKVPFPIVKKLIALVKDNKDVPPKLLFNNEQIVFSLQTLIEATGGFRSNNKLGEGGFGSVYKGVLQDGQEIAIKKLLGRSGQGIREFLNEVEIVANIQHRNLLKLLGCCVEGDERLLIYEFLPNKSLDTFLFDPIKSRQLDWEKRYDIIVGIARGLLYLHQDSRVRIIHRDIKANNVLLDERLNPKIGDFGLARLFPDNETEIQSRVAGTYGYMAPEYAMRGHLSVKIDVYSFGVLLLEILSGRKNTDIKLLKEKEISSLLEWAWRLYKQGNMLSMVDGVVAETCPEEQALRCIHVGLLCTQADADVRPLMSRVVLMITSNSEPLPNPKKPAYVSMGHSPNASQNPCSNLLSITVSEAR